MLRRADRLVTHLAGGVAELLWLDLGPQDERHWLLVQTVHRQVFDSEDVLVHGKELLRVDAQDGLANLPEAANRERSATVGDANGEVVGRHAVLERAHAGLAVVTGA